MGFISDLIINVSAFRIKIGEKLNTIANRIGNLPSLTTVNKNNLVGAINEVNLKASNAVNYLNIVKTVSLNGAQYDHNTWYPVVGTISLANDKTSTIYVNMSLEGLSNPSWSTHQNGFVVDFMIETIGGGWGATKSETRVLRDNVNWVVSENDSQKPVGFVQTFANSSPILYLRGGGVYYVRTDFEAQWTVRSNGYVDPMNNQFFGLSNQRALIFDENIVKHGIKSDNIETYNCGKASDWFHTFKRGLVYRGEITNNTNAHLLDFGGYMNVTGNGEGNTNFPYSYGSTFRLPSEEGFSPILHFSHTGELTITTEWMYGFQSDRVVWDSINLNPNTFASNNELNNIYDQLSAKANTRLGNLAWGLSSSEQEIIRQKLGINTSPGGNEVNVFDLYVASQFQALIDSIAGASIYHSKAYFRGKTLGISIAIGNSNTSVDVAILNASIGYNMFEFPLEIMERLNNEIVEMVPNLKLNTDEFMHGLNNGTSYISFSDGRVNHTGNLVVKRNSKLVLTAEFECLNV